MIGSYEYKIVNILPPKDQNAQTVASDIVSMKNYDHCTIIIQFGVCNTSSATTTNLILYKGENVTTCNTATACKGYRAELDATADTLGALTTMATTGVSLGSGNTEDIDTGGGFIVLEVDAEDLEPTIANPYDTIRIGMVWAAQSTIMSAVAILSKGRYKNKVMPTAITN